MTFTVVLDLRHAKNTKDNVKLKSFLVTEIEKLASHLKLNIFVAKLGYQARGC